MSKDWFTKEDLQAAGQSPKSRSLEPQALSAVTAGSCTAPHPPEPGNAGLGLMLVRVSSPGTARAGMA